MAFHFLSSPLSTPVSGPSVRRIRSLANHPHAGRLADRPRTRARQLTRPPARPPPTRRPRRSGAGHSEKGSIETRFYAVRRSPSPRLGRWFRSDLAVGRAANGGTGGRAGGRAEGRADGRTGGRADGQAGGRAAWLEGECDKHRIEG